MPDLSVVLYLVTVLTGGVSVLLLVNTKTLRDSRDDQEKRISFLEAKSERDDVTIKAQADQIIALGKVVTGEAHLVAISDLLTEHHGEALANWATVGRTLAHVDSTMTDLAIALERRQM